MPIKIEVMERHPDGTQLFYPLQDRDWLVVVCTNPHDAQTYRAFLATGRQGVNYHRNIWHHPLLVLDRDYMTVPADAIKDLKPVITMVGGKVVYERK